MRRNRALIAWLVSLPLLLGLVSGCAPDVPGKGAAEPTRTVGSTATVKRTTPVSDLGPPAVQGVIAFTTLAAGEPAGNRTPGASGTQDYDVCVVNADGTGLTTLAGGEPCQWNPRWSPDGSRILYTVSAIGVEDPQDVWVMNADGTGKTQLTKGPFRNTSAVWSPDGTRIAYSSQVSKHDPFKGAKTESASIWVMNADGSGAHTVTTPTGGIYDCWPAWAEPDKISFVRLDLTGKATAECSVNPDGSGLVQVRPLGDMQFEFFTYYELAPGGERAAVQNLKANPDTLSIVPASGDGPGVTLLSPVDDYLGKRRLAAVGWKRDGSAVAITGRDDPGTRIYVVKADGSGLSVVPGVEKATFPDWRP